MRSGLPSAFNTARNAASTQPVNLLVFKFAAGDVYASDRALGAAQGLSHDYLGLVRDWGELSDLPLDEAGVAETRELSLTLWNGGAEPFSDRFQEEDPEAVEVELWQWFLATPESAAVLIDTFAVSDPVAYDEASRELRLDLVSLSSRIDCQVGDLIEAADWPNAPQESIGRMIPLVFGEVPGLPCGCVDAPAQAKLATSILPTDLTIPVDDASLFPATGVIQIDDERLLYRSRTDTAFTVTKRGYGDTVATDHLPGRAVSEVAGQVYAACKGPVTALTNVKVDGVAPETAYTTQPDADPATITFDGPPQAASLAEASRFLEMQFDSVAAGNTALKPDLAFDVASSVTAAELSQGHPELRLSQTTVNPNRGEIRKAYLGVEHWESEKLPHDYVEAEVVGLGVLGRLSAPHPADTTTVQADVDIDHGHTDSFEDEHTHPFTDRNEALREEAHTHGNTGPAAFTGTPSDTSIKAWSYTFDNWGNKIYWTGGGAGGQYITVTFSGLPGSGSGYLEVRFRNCATFLGRWPRGTYQDGRGNCGDLGGGDKLGDVDCNKINDYIIGRYSISAPIATIYLSAEKKFCWAGDQGYAQIDYVKQYINTAAVQPTKTGISLQVLDPGHNLSTAPLTGEVIDHTGANVPLTNVQVSQPSRTSADLFDITSHVAGNWGWFTGKELRVRYQGSADGRTCYVLHAWFEVEYAPREVKAGGLITCDVDGLRDDALGTITGTPLRPIRRPDEVRTWLLVALAGLAAARIDSDSFGAAASRYNELGYGFDLALQERTTLKELEVRLARQCRSRFYWDAGSAKIALRERDADLAPAKSITAGMILLDSMRAERSRVADLANQVSLFYRKDPASAEAGAAGYLASVRGSQEESIAAHGARERPGDFLFDAVREPAMAADLLAFYLEKQGRISTSYTFDCFLDAFELEKEDAVRLTHPFDTLAGNIAVVRAASRVLGSGEANQADLVRVTAELLPRRRWEVALEEELAAREVLGIDKGFEIHLADQARIGSRKWFGLGLGLAEAVGARFGQALRFDGVDNYVRVADAAELRINDNMTVEFWLSAQPGPVDPDYNCVLFKASATAGWNICQNYNTTKLEVRLDTPGDGGQVAQHKVVNWTVFDGLAHHCAVTLSGGLIKVYIDGTLRLDTTYLHGGGFSSTADLLWGGYPDPPNRNWLYGTLDEVRLWNVVRSGAEIQAAMNQALGGGEPGLVAYWRLNEGQGVVAADATGHGHDATLVNPPAWTSGLLGAVSIIHDVRLSLAEEAAVAAALDVTHVTPAGMAETVGVTENLTISISGELALDLADATGHSDALAAALGYHQALTDSAHPTDSLTVALSGGFGKGGYGTTPYGR